MNGPAGGRLLYVDAWAGLAGDMLLSALLELGDHLGVDLEAVLERTVASLGIEGAGVVRERGTEGGFACSRVSVEAPASQPSRSPSDLTALVEAAALPAEVRGRAVRAIERIARVEARLHGVALEEVHLHELGGVDTLVDVVGVFALVEALGVESVAAGPVPVGAGTVRTEHGPIGVPAPATLELLQGVPIRGGALSGETTTPTGALLVTELATSWGPLPAMTVEGAGFGAGHKAFAEGPNLLRLVAGKRSGDSVAHGAGTEGSDRCVVLETVVDDVSAEVVAYGLERLLSAGALDAYASPVVMKKGRPGVAVTVIGGEDDETLLVRIMFDELGTLGIRRQLLERHVRSRRFVDVEVEGQAIRVKLAGVEGPEQVIAPEFEDCRRAAASLGRPLRWVMGAASRQARNCLSLEAK